MVGRDHLEYVPYALGACASTDTILPLSIDVMCLHVALPYPFFDTKSGTYQDFDSSCPSTSSKKTDEKTRPDPQSPRHLINNALD